MTGKPKERRKIKKVEERIQSIEGYNLAFGDPAVLDAFVNQGPRISVSELARLVESRIRNLPKCTDGGPAVPNVFREIESVLEIVQACQLMLSQRKIYWKDYVDKMVVTYCNGHSSATVGLVKPSMNDTLRRDIEGEEYPIPFEKGLQVMGVGGDSKEERVEKFREFLKCKFAKLLRLDPVTEKCNDEELKLFIGFRESQPWQNAAVLWESANEWHIWYKQKKKEERRKAGRRSREVMGARQKPSSSSTTKQKNGPGPV
jgi:hypothetical protein